MTILQNDIKKNNEAFNLKETTKKEFTKKGLD